MAAQAPARAANGGPISRGARTGAALLPLPPLARFSLTISRQGRPRWPPQGEPPGARKAARIKIAQAPKGAGAVPTGGHGPKGSGGARRGVVLKVPGKGARTGSRKA